MAEPEYLVPDPNGIVHININQVGRLELGLDGRLKNGLDNWFGSSSWTGYLVGGKELQPIPIGSRLDPKTSVFTWQLGPAFLGEYQLVFIRDQGSLSVRNQIVVNVNSELNNNKKIINRKK